MSRVVGLREAMLVESMVWLRVDQEQGGRKGGCLIEGGYEKQSRCMQRLRRRNVAGFWYLALRSCGLRFWATGGRIRA